MSNLQELTLHPQDIDFVEFDEVLSNLHKEEVGELMSQVGTEGIPLLQARHRAEQLIARRQK